MRFTELKFRNIKPNIKLRILKPLLTPLQNRGYRQFIRNHLESFHEKKLADVEFIILTNNCWGYQLYKSLERKYNTPFVGLFLYPECYIKFISDIDFYLESRFEITYSSRYYAQSSHYPIGILNGDVEIHFLHYQNSDECISKWERRKERLKKSLQIKGSRIFAKMCDKQCQDSHIKRFHQIPNFFKISFGAKDMNIKSHLSLKSNNLVKRRKTFEAPDGEILYSKRYCYFDIVEWIKTGKIKHTLWSRFLGLLA